jgi:glycosyltransferase involved in cell wall biosynthesis
VITGAMRVAAYVHPHRAHRDGTGVAKHIVQMVGGLADSPGVDLRLLVSASDIGGNGRIGDTSPLCRLPAVGLPLGRRAREWLWNLTGRPRADRWTGDVDWVYCPAETYVPVRRARLAATMHSLMWYDERLDAYRSRAFRRNRLRWQFLVGPILRHAHRVLCVSDYLAGEYARIFGVERKKLYTVGNGVEEEYFGPPSGDPPVSPPSVLAVGGLTYIKGADYLLDVAAALARVAPAVRLVVAGFHEPPYRERAETMANVVVLGFEKVEAIHRLLAHSIALVYLSRYDSFGIPIAEAMAAGVPVLYAPNAGLPEVAGDVGVAVDPTAPNRIAARIADLARDDHARAQLGAAGRRRADERFRWRDCVRRLLEALR